MNIVVYSTTAKPNTINKPKTAIKTITGNAIEALDIISPRIRVKIDNVLIDSNYVYIEKFKRYYFIKSITVDKGFMILNLNVDVLESFKTDILEYNGIIARQEFDYNLFLEDSEMSAYSQGIITYRKFPKKPFQANVTSEQKKFVLITTSDD